MTERRVRPNKMAEAAGVTVSTLLKWRKLGLPFEKDARKRVWYDPEAVSEWLEENGRTGRPGRPSLVQTMKREKYARKLAGEPEPEPLPRLTPSPDVVTEATTMDLAAAKLRKELALAEKHELAVARVKGELLDADEVERDRVRRVSVIKARLLQLAATAAPLCAGRDEGEIERIITEEVLLLLADFARGARDTEGEM